MANRKNYVVQGQGNVASSGSTKYTCSGTSLVRPNIYDLILGSSATPADNALLWQLQRFTAQGTGSSYTPVALDPADPSGVTGQAVVTVNNTVEPTYTSNAYVLRIAVNQRATHRWIADPDAPIRLPATASNGVGMYCLNSSFNGAVDFTVFHYE